ncbi:uncharacterized protein FOMMEDRAFT_30381 [Fomitiporia mediterranea MF3/22]|uniref:uncharacterized protein n=1 Tax=Fomitiporia mediterranea (strain MF3/22) TaxID=694068 RepID=UPI0004409B7A|nr:uncharacterized protein FOMMEDRAFT_30381 [Fomitiporia mediterranea MF3/22]EJD00289.1 hypothetical protein FOMMEDRAFT_30381 [Fomitiporia mediterranea MF3/22]
MFRRSRAPSTPTTPASPSTGQEGNDNEISDNYEVVQTPSGSNPNSLPSSSSDAGRPAATRRESRRRHSQPSPPTPGVTPPPHVRQASSRDDWYPSWLPRRPPPPAPASTVPSERGHGHSPIPFMSSPSNAGTTRGGRPMASGAHRMTPSYDTGYTGYTGTGESGEYVDIGEYDFDPALAESEGTEERVGIGRRQTPRSVRIISEATAAAAASRRQSASRHSRRLSSSGVQQQVRSRKEGRAGHVHGSGPKPWWRGTVSTPLSPTVVSPSPFPGALGPMTTDVPPPSAPAHMRAYLPHPGMPGVGGYNVVGSVPLRPRFRAPGLDLGFLSNPSALNRLRYILWPIWVYGLVVLQSFLDLNAIYCLVQLALHPTPASPPSSSSNNSNPSSSRNWALGAAGYGVCWLFWIVGIIFIYEVVYCWWRRWRCKRPLMIPLYLSAPAYNIVCMTSFVNFCFFRYIRSSARPRLPVPRFLRPCGSSTSGSTIPSRAVTPSAMSVATEARPSQQQERETFISPTTAEGKENVPMVIPSTTARSPILESMSSLASWGDWFAETCYFYGQNLPTVALLLPRAALCVAILLAFTSSQPEDRALGALGLMKRDQTFFRPDGSLSGYARGVLLANVAWAAWRVVILLISWVGLWLMSGQLCAGVCGPRFRWEEPEERPGYAKGLDEEQFEEAQGVLSTWTWRACTRARVYDAYDLCLFLPPPSTKAAEKARDVSTEKSARRAGGVMDESEEDAVLDRVLAAAGLPKAPPPARRGMLRGELFNTPPELRRELSEEAVVQEITISSPKPPGTREGSSRSSRERPPSNMKPYPFTTYPARQGSQDMGTPSQVKIPFPPSPRTSKHSDREGSGHEAEEEGEEEEEDVEEEGEEDIEVGEGYDEFGLNVEEPSSGRNSASMSSLGQQIPSRFPFQFRHISRRSRGGRSSVGTQQSRSNSNKTSSASYGASHASRTISSSDRRQSQVSDSPWSQSQRSPEASAAQSPVSPHEGATSSSSYGSPISGHLGGQSVIPMPPRTARKTRQQRASLPTLPVSAIPAGFSGARDRSRTLSGGTQASSGLNLTPHPQYESSGGEESEHEQGTSREFGMLTDPEADGSQEEAEREDSVGLLSGGPSPRSSLGMLRSRSNLSLTNLNLGIPHSRRSRHSSASSVSHSHSRSSRGSRSVSFTGSGSQGASARSRSISTQARSRAQSLVQGTVGAASHSNGEFACETVGSALCASSVERIANAFRVVLGIGRFERDLAIPASRGSGSGRQGSSPRELSPHSRRMSRQEATIVPETARELQSQVSGVAPTEQSQQTTAPASSSLPIPETNGISRPSQGGAGAPSLISSADDTLIAHPTSQEEGSSDTAV